MSFQEQKGETDQTIRNMWRSNPREYAIPLMMDYLPSYQSISEISLCFYQESMALSSIIANWADYIKEDIQGVRDYLDMGFKALKTSDSVISRRYLSEPIVRVLRSLSRVDEGKDTFDEYFKKTQEFCNENPEFKNLGVYLLPIVDCESGEELADLIEKAILEE